MKVKDACNLKSRKTQDESDKEHKGKAYWRLQETQPDQHEEGPRWMTYSSDLKQVQ